MTLENLYFRKDFYYDAEQVENYIGIIQTSTSSKRVRAYKNLVFMMMKDIVKKNISNFLNLLRGIDSPNIPERDDLVTNCYITFDKCLEKYIVGRGYNFYFYFNKSLSRNFFREYQREMKRINASTEVTEAISHVSKEMRVDAVYSSVEFVIDNSQFTPLEKKICHSKVSGLRASDFLKMNPEVTNSQYSRALKSVKNKLLLAKENNEI